MLPALAVKTHRDHFVHCCLLLSNFIPVHELFAECRNMVRNWLSFTQNSRSINSHVLLFGHGCLDMHEIIRIFEYEKVYFDLQRDNITLFVLFGWILWFHCHIDFYVPGFKKYSLCSVIPGPDSAITFVSCTMVWDILKSRLLPDFKLSQNVPNQSFFKLCKFHLK